ncbi:MAG: YdcH family protein [Rhodospirillales bacterium]
MSLQEQTDGLKQRHQTLQSEIDDEETRPLPDEAHIAALKKQKLKIKDRLADH